MESNVQNNESEKEMLKLAEFGQNIRINISSSKQKLSNDQAKGKTNSKLPRIVRQPVQSKFCKGIEDLKNFNNQPGESLPGSSKMTGLPMKIKKDDLTVKPKASLIPRRKCNKEENCELPKKTETTNNQFIPECRNVQRVQMLINQEFCPEDRVPPPASVQSTRPIPTLGQIYGRINMIDSDRLNDWFMEFAPINTTASNPRNECCEDLNEDDGASSTVASPANCHQQDHGRTTLILDRKNNIMNELQTTNENVTVWLSSDVEFPTRDTESGYKTMSSKNVEKSYVLSHSEYKTANSNKSFSLGVLQDNSSALCATSKPDSECSEGPSLLLKEQQTVVLCVSPDAVKKITGESTGSIPKTNITIKISQVPKPVVSEPKKSSQPTDQPTHCPVNVSHAIAVPTQRIPVPSYTECFSEILQRTTNFEMMDAIGVENERTTSSAATKDTQDNMSNEETTEGEKDGLEEFVVEAPTSPEWGRLENQSHSNQMTNEKSAAATTEWSYKYKSDTSETDYKSTEIPNHDSSWTDKNEFFRRHSDYNANRSLQDICPECHRYNRFPSSRYKMPSPFETWRRRTSIRRICRRRWNHVWKKTAERWAAWSMRSPVRFKKFHVRHHLKRGIIWEDANVQTYTPVYNETGTDSAPKELKSAAIGTVFNVESWLNMSHPNESTCSDHKPKIKHSNLGPTMYPFLYNSEQKSPTAIPIKLETSRVQCHPCYRDNCNSATNNINKFSWSTNKIDFCKSCQYEDIRIIPNTVKVERSTSFTQMYEVSLSDEHTDTSDLPYFMYDKVTSTFMRTDPYRMSMGVSKDAFTQKIIMCHNAETDVSFLPMFNHSSTGTITSTCDITYYKPYTGSEITELNETKTQQSVYPALRKLQSRAISARQNNDISEIDTQMSPGLSVDKVTTGIATSKLKLFEKTTSFPTKDIMILREETDLVEEQKPELSSQTEEIKPEPATETETQMSPGASIATVSTGVTPVPSPIEVHATINDSVKESYAVQTASIPIHPTNLALTATKIMSISSRQLLPTSNTPSTEITDGRPTVACNVSFRQNCTCTPLNVVTCGTDVKIADLHCTRETSAGEVDSYYETQLLLNNLIKKALMGKASHQLQSQELEVTKNQPLVYVTTSTSTHVGLETKAIGPTMSEITELISLCKTEIGVQYVEDKIEKEAVLDESEKSEDAPSINSEGQDPIVSMCMLNRKTSDLPTQTEFDALGPLKSASIMTSYCGQAESIQVPAISVFKVETISTTEKPSFKHAGSYLKSSTENPPSTEKPASVSSHLSSDIQTNTDTNLTNLEAQQSGQKSIEFSQSIKPSSNNTLDKPLTSKTRRENDIKKQITSLSRLMGKKRHSSTISTPVLAQFSTPFCSEMTTENWMNECHSVRKAYPELTISDEEEVQKDKIAIGPPTITLSKDSLEDVLPINRVKNKSYIKNNETDITLNRAMVDEVTSDVNVLVTKEVKESILQACPDICETESSCRSNGSKFRIIVKLDSYYKNKPYVISINFTKGTEWLLETQKSASVLTTQCVLPSPPPCSGNLLPVHGSNNECVFVYGEPHCAIHRKSADAAAQIESTGDSDHSVGMLTSLCALRAMRSQRKSSVQIEEALSPKVYKALYETTKLVVSDSKKPNSGDSHVVFRADAEVEAAKVPDVRSAGVVTSDGRASSLPRKKSSCKDRGTHAHNHCTLYRVTNNEHSEKALTHTKLLNMTEETKEGLDEYLRTHLVSSCRYYSGLLTKQFGRVKNNLTKHLAQPLEEPVQTPRLPVYKVEACTMKPSGRTALASQTIKYRPYYKTTKHMSCCILSPAISLTDISQHDKRNLQSVYYMLSAIDGRLRRLKLSTHNVY